MLNKFKFGWRWSKRPFLHKKTMKEMLEDLKKLHSSIAELIKQCPRKDECTYCREVEFFEWANQQK